MNKSLQNILGSFFEIIPFNVAVINHDYDIIKANGNFVEYFGDWQEKKCYEVCKKINYICKNCKVEEVFNTGRMITSEEVGKNKEGETTNYEVHFVPVRNDKGVVDHVVEISKSTTEAANWQRGYSLLFEKVPCYITIIDKDFNIIRANQKYIDTFGNPKGKSCYQVYKNRRNPCTKCPALVSFKEGVENSSREIGISKNGDEIHYVVNTAPLMTDKNGDVQLVIEMSTDITEINELEVQLKQAHDFYATLIQNSPDAIIAIDKAGKTQIFNPAARKLFKWPHNRKPGTEKITALMPEEFFNEVDDNGYITKPNEYDVKDTEDMEFPVRMNAFQMQSRGKEIGRVAFLHDLREIKKLEKQTIFPGKPGSFGETLEGMTIKFSDLIAEIKKHLEDENIIANDIWLKGKLKELEEIARLSAADIPNLKIVSPADLIENVFEKFSQKLDNKKGRLNLKASSLKNILIDSDGFEIVISKLLNYIFHTCETIKGKIKVVDLIPSDIGEDLVLEIAVKNVVFKEKCANELPILKARKIVNIHGGEFKLIDSKIIMKFNRPKLEILAEEIYKKNFR